MANFFERALQKAQNRAASARQGEEAQRQAAITQSFAPAFQAVNEQFAPTFRRARASLAANPAFARSGAANRLNRTIQGSAVSELARSLAGESAGAARGRLDLINDMIRRRQEARLQQQQEERNRPGIGGAIGGIVGGIASRAVDKFLPF